MSSKLLDGTHAIISAVPWLSGVKEENHDPVPLQFAGQVGTVSVDEQVQAEMIEDRQSARDPIVDHSACEAQIDRLHVEMQRLGVQLAEEKRVAYREGFEAGVAEESSKWSEAIARSAKAIAELAAYKPRMRAQVEADAVRLALAIARKILHREATTDPETIAGLVRVALERINVRDLLRLRVSGKDADGLKACLGDLGLPVQVELILDQSLERGGVVLETEQGHVDASIDTQLCEIERGLADALEHGRRR